MLKMPVLRPIPVKTKNQPYLKALWRWLFEIRKWELFEEWRYRLKDGNQIMIPKGFIFDGASIPRPFWIILSPVGLLLIPGLLHDYAYRYGRLEKISHRGKISPYKPDAGRLFWDRLFRDEAIKVNGFWFINHLAWLALIVAGWFAWYSYRNKKPNI